MLVKHLGGSDVAGSRMKGALGWNRPGRGAVNASGFDGAPGGGRGRNGEFGERGNHGTWWSATEYDADYAWHWGLSRQSSAVSRNAGHMASGFCVRCVKD